MWRIGAGLFAAAGLHVAESVSAGDGIGGEELIHGEFDVAENLTGVILAAAAGALLVGHAVIIHRHQKLSLALQANDGELTQGDIDPLALAAEAQVAAEYRVGDVSGMVGIHDGRYFSNMFKKKYGMTPTEYRNR